MFATAVVIVVVLVVGVALSGVFSLGPYVVSGIADGAIYALAALGLVLTYKTSGIFNFAIGAQAAASAYVFYSLRETVGLPWPVAALGSLLLVGLVGSLLLERMAYWLTGAPAAMRVVATIGLLVLLESALTGAYGVATIQFSAFLPGKGFHLFGVNVLASQLIVVAIAVAATIGLYVFFKRARIGVAMQAVVDSPILLALEATNPVSVRRYAWAIGSCFISISGMLLAPTLGIDIDVFLLVYIAAFGAAAIGGFSSLPVTFAAAMGIGVTMNVLSDKLAGQTNLVLAELYTQIPFLVLVAALLLVPRAKLVTRGTGVVRKLRPAVTFSLPVVAVGATAGIAIAVAIPFVVASAFVNQYTTGIGYAVVLASLGLLLWTSGQISLCQLAFAAIGATTFGHALGAGWPWLAALLAAVVVAVAAGAVAAIPSFRLSGVYLAVATFGFGLLVQNLIFPTFLMFGQSDSVTIPRPNLLGVNATSDRAYYFLALSVAALCALMVIGVRRSRLGRLLRGLSDSPEALEAHGTNTRLTRLYVFCISAGIAAVGGVLIGGVTQTAGGTASGPFGYFNSVVLLAVLSFCGSQPLLSPVIAAFVFEVVRVYRPFNTAWFASYEGVFFGVAAIAVAVVPGINLPVFGRRVSEREGSSPVASRGRISLRARGGGAYPAPVPGASS
jgi:branched-subunit amino acid ABC-type transport system permease component